MRENRSMPRCLIALGSNLGEKSRLLSRAIKKIHQIAATRVIRESRVVESAPVGGPAGQEVFKNQVAVVETDLAPHALLAELQAIESRLDRRRGERWVSRTIDLDILLCDEQIIATAELCLPHPRMTFRPFVIEPAVEVAGDWRHPELKASLAEIDRIRRTGADVIRVAGAPDRCEVIAHAALEAGVALPMWVSSSECFLSVRGAASDQEVAPRLQILAGEAATPTRAAPMLRLDRTTDGAIDRERVAEEVAAAIACVWPGLGRGAG